MSMIINRFPKFNMPYETAYCNNKSPEYDIALAIPYGKKVYIWFTFDNENDNCYLLDINKDKNVIPIDIINACNYNELSRGTLLYGTNIVDEDSHRSIIMIEDIIMYKGVLTNKIAFNKKILCITETIQYINNLNINYICCLPMIYDINSPQPDNIAYNVHHLQYRSTSQIKPYLNLENSHRNHNELPIISVNNYMNHIQVIKHKFDFSKPQYKLHTTFQCYADLQTDIYHLYAYSKNNIQIYYNLAYIPNYKTSVFMNSIFRNIRENDNLDYIEESDDEDDFQNTDINKYVDMNKMVLVECVFNVRFKKWVPIRELPNNNKVIHINRLV